MNLPTPPWHVHPKLLQLLHFITRHWVWLQSYMEMSCSFANSPAVSNIIHFLTRKQNSSCESASSHHEISNPWPTHTAEATAGRFGLHQMDIKHFLGFQMFKHAVWQNWATAKIWMDPNDNWQRNHANYTNGKDKGVSSSNNKITRTLNIDNETSFVEQLEPQNSSHEKRSVPMRPASGGASKATTCSTTQSVKSRGRMQEPVRIAAQKMRLM